MHDWDMTMMSQDFYACWRHAGRHLDALMDGGKRSWLRAHPYPPFIEHFAFRLGNQIFFVRVEDADGKIESPGDPEHLLNRASDADSHACVMPMRRHRDGDTWQPAEAGWGLLDAVTGESVDPLSLVSDELIEMTDWEVQDMAVEVVRQHVESKGHKVTSWQGDPRIDPSIWFIGDSKQFEWVIVRAVRYPTRRAQQPDNWNEIAAGCAKLGSIGHFASVALASSKQRDARDDSIVPLWRGHAMHIAFEGLETPAPASGVHGPA
jgi:hypothetical protein